MGIYGTPLTPLKQQTKVEDDPDAGVRDVVKTVFGGLLGAMTEAYDRRKSEAEQENKIAMQKDEMAKALMSVYGQGMVGADTAGRKSIMESAEKLAKTPKTSVAPSKDTIGDSLLNIFGGGGFQKVSKGEREIVPADPGTSVSEKKLKDVQAKGDPTIYKDFADKVEKANLALANARKARDAKAITTAEAEQVAAATNFASYARSIGVDLTVEEIKVYEPGKFAAFLGFKPETAVAIKLNDPKNPDKKDVKKKDVKKKVTKADVYARYKKAYPSMSDADIFGQEAYKLAPAK